MESNCAPLSRLRCPEPRRGQAGIFSVKGAVTYVYLRKILHPLDTNRTKSHLRSEKGQRETDTRRRTKAGGMEVRKKISIDYKQFS